MLYRAIFLLAAAALGMTGCTVAENNEIGSPEDTGIPVSDEYSPTIAIVDWGAVDLTDPAVVQDFAQADFIVLETAYLLNGRRNAGGIAAIKELNPDVRIVGYVSAHASWLSWGDPDADLERSEYYTRDWYEATEPYWSYTTTGDTMCSWPGKVLLNVLDPDCRAAMVGVLADHWTAHDNVLDGIFWDHFNHFLWVPNDIEGVEGLMDLDGDGITHREDEDEMAAYRIAVEDLVRRARRALGNDVIQIANGQRAPADSNFAALLDGMFYEDFPAYNYTGEKMRQALDREVPNNLFAAHSWCRTQNGGPWLILSNWDRFYAPDDDGNVVAWRRSDFNRVVGLLSGCLSVYYPSASYRYDWPEVELELGLPLAEAVQTGDLVSREFENGTVLLDFGAATGQIPFGFAIVQNDSLRQRFQYEEELP